MGEKLTMKDLIAKKGRSQDIMANVSPRIRNKIRGDLLLVLAAKREGKPIPGRRQLAAFIRETYDFRVAPTTIGDWLARLEKETECPNAKSKT